MKALIDIGHADGSGARGNGLEEHAQCVRIAEVLGSLLQGSGWDVDVMDWPEESNSSDLNKAIDYGAKSDADILVSLHCDCSDNAAARGAHVCYYSDAGKLLAGFVAQPLAELLPGRAERTQYRSLSILRKTKPVAILCECGFLSNAEDARFIAESPAKIAFAIYQGLLAYKEKYGY